MKKKRLGEEQIVAVLKEAEADAKALSPHATHEAVGILTAQCQTGARLRR